MRHSLQILSAVFTTSKQDPMMPSNLGGIKLTRGTSETWGQEQRLGGADFKAPSTTPSFLSALKELLGS